ISVVTKANAGAGEEVTKAVQGAVLQQAVNAADAAAAAGKTASDAAFAAVCNGACDRPTDPAAQKKQNEALADAAVLKAKQNVADAKAALADLKKSGASQGQLD